MDNLSSIYRRLWKDKEQGRDLRIFDMADDIIPLGVWLAADNSRFPENILGIGFRYSRKGFLEFVRASRDTSPAPLSHVIVDWDLTNEDGSPFPLDSMELPTRIYTSIVEAVTDDFRRRFPGDWLRLRDEIGSVPK